MELVVTTGRRFDAAMEARAAQVAARLGVAYAPRAGQSVETLRAAHGAEAVYVVGREREEVQRGDEVFWVHPGTFYLRRADGPGHPLLRAARPEGAAPVGRLIDATLGMANDALHLAWGLEAEVVGIEASGVVFSLAEGALVRMGQERRGYAAAARRIEPVWGRAIDVLDAMDAGSADVVFLDPLFETPRAAMPGYGLLRRLACEERLSVAWLDAARRVARRRVVVKLPGAAPPPAPGFNRRVRGGAVDYAIIELEVEPDSSREGASGGSRLPP